MRVLFDAYWWDEGAFANRTVQREFISTWSALYPDDEVILAVPRKAAAQGVPPAATVVHTTLWPHGLANRLQLPGLARRTAADVTIVHNYAPRRGRSAVFIHDVMFLDHPEWFSRAERVYFHPMLRWARSAEVVAASTHTEAARIRRLARGTPDPVVTGLGVPPALALSTPQRPAGLPEVDGFAVTVGRLNVRKNLERILAAAPLAARLGPRHPLVVVGSTAHSGVSTAFAPAVQASIDEGHIVLLGGVSDDNLAWLYAHTSLVITLSRDEGFGMPATEAAHFNAPLIASDIPVFLETVGDYARFVSPDAAPVDIAAAIDEHWGAVCDGAEVRARYTWENAVHTLRTAIVGEAGISAADSAAHG